MTTYLLLGGALFAGCILGGALIGWWQWWLPRHRLMIIFREARRVRLARAAAEPVPVAPVVSLLTVLAAVT